MGVRLSTLYFAASRTHELPMSTPIDHDELVRRISRDLADGYDEELELELEDRHPLPTGSSAAETETDYRRGYFQQLFRLQAELVKLQDWVIASRQKVLILFEGRDAAGKGGAIKRVNQKLNPRACRVVALPAPNDARARARARARAPPTHTHTHTHTQTHTHTHTHTVNNTGADAVVLLATLSRTFPRPAKSFCSTAAGNRAGVEHRMGFCTSRGIRGVFPLGARIPGAHEGTSGNRLLKYWFSITDEEQYLRFLGRIHDPLKQWKLSPMDLESRRRWEAYTKAKEVMLERSHIREAPWWVVHAVDKQRARLNFIDHLLRQFPTKRCRDAADRVAATRTPRALFSPGGTGRDVGAGDILTLSKAVTVRKAPRK